MSSNNKASNAGAKTGNVVKDAFHKIHGAGEAIRGNINTFADNVTHSDSSHSEAITQRGLNEMNSTRVGRQTQAQTGSVGHEAAPQQADFGVQAGAGNVGQVGVGQPGVSHVDPQAEYGAPGSQQPHLGHMAGLEHSGNAAQGGISRVDPQAEYAAPGSQYNQAGNQTRQGQTGKGFAHAMNGSSGVNKDAAQGGVYEGGRPL